MHRGQGGLCVFKQLTFSEIQTELSNLPNFAAKFDKLGKCA